LNGFQFDLALDPKSAEIAEYDTFVDEIYGQVQDDIATSRRINPIVFPWPED